MEENAVKRIAGHFRGVDSRTPNLACRGLCCAMLGTLVMSALVAAIAYWLSTP